MVVTFPFLQSVGNNYEYAAAHEQLGRLWNHLGVPHLDLLPVFEGSPAGQITVNRYDPHPNEQAMAMAAGAIEPFLLEQIETNRITTGKSPTQ